MIVEALVDRFILIELNINNAKTVAQAVGYEYLDGHTMGFFQYYFIEVSHDFE